MDKSKLNNIKKTASLFPFILPAVVIMADLVSLSIFSVNLFINSNVVAASFWAISIKISINKPQ